MQRILAGLALGAFAASAFNPSPTTSLTRQAKSRSPTSRLRSSPDTPDEEEDDAEAARRRYTEMMGGGASGVVNVERAVPRIAKPVPRRDDSRPLGLQDEAVPTDQQPAQELLDLKKAPIFKSAQLEDSEFGFFLLKTYAAIFFVVSLPISLVTYDWQTSLAQALVAANFGTVVLEFFLLLRLYVGWTYVGDRLVKDVGYYEESGWYDGFLSVKPPEIVARDKLLYDYEVEPAIKRVTTFGAAALALMLGSFLLLKVVAPADPYAYLEQDYLQNVLQDDARAAAEQRRVLERGGSAKPTYCDDRYYRAVAGGGGCSQW
eukprot:CAMPEP_0172609568 /NCGR_PEP_ID=MMETSP1068-20121228/29549_1 /TAXON_ID=35684 /ORGANISM="Pseudopedinella elastica, Strain CCMP716" /LENGTH=317 /DNA_ID=CAMNT_0013413121 /DNA_START=48 /DNA_END=998 /DNA_ORIENTATION=-